MSHLGRSWPFVALLAVGLMHVVVATAADDAPTELPPVEVFPGQDPLSETDRGLGRLRQSLPGLGSETPPPLSRGERLMQWLFTPQDLNEASELQQDMAERLDDPDAHLRKGR